MAPYRFIVSAVASFVVSLAAQAAAPVQPTGFKTANIQTADGATIHVRTGGKGPAVVLIHGFGDTGDMWGPLATRLARNHTVIVPDLRGLGLSPRPAGGYDKKSQVADIRAVVEQLARTAPTWSATTSAPWWPTRMRPATQAR